MKAFAKIFKNKKMIFFKIHLKLNKIKRCLKTFHQILEVLTENKILLKMKCNCNQMLFLKILM